MQLAGFANPIAGRLFDAILFDLGNTLIYFDGKWPEVIARANLALWRSLKTAGLEIDKEVFLQEFANRLNAYYVERETEFIEYTTYYVLTTLLDELGYPGIPEPVIRPALSALYTVTRVYWQVEADTHTTLQELKHMGYRLAIISNAGDDEDVQALVDKAQVRHFFDLIVSSAALGIRKPNPKIFNTVLDQLGLEPSQAVMVGDTLGADILGAQNAHIFSVLITRRADTPANRAHKDTIIPDAVISSLSELPSLLESYIA